MKLAQAIKMSLPLERSKESLKVFDDEYDKAYISGMRKKVFISYTSTGLEWLWCFNRPEFIGLHYIHDVNVYQYYFNVVS